MDKLNDPLIEAIVRSVIEELLASGMSEAEILCRLSGDKACGESKTCLFEQGGAFKDSHEHEVDIKEDITSRAVKSVPLLTHPEDEEALKRMMRLTTARIGVGGSGREQDKDIADLAGSPCGGKGCCDDGCRQRFVVPSQSVFGTACCRDKNEYLTRPDLGRRLSKEGVAAVKQQCVKTPDVQICVSDGLSSTAINANIENIMPILTEGLKEKGLTVGTPFFVKYGRVGVEDEIAELVGAKVVCDFCR